MGYHLGKTVTLHSTHSTCSPDDCFFVALWDICTCEVDMGENKSLVGSEGTYWCLSAFTEGLCDPVRCDYRNK